MRPTLSLVLGLSTVLCAACGDTSPAPPTPPPPVPAELDYGSVSRGRCSPVWATWGQAPNERLGQQLVRIGDMDGDRVTDVVASASSVGDPVRLRIISGATGRLIRTFSVAAEQVFTVTALGDVDGDRVPDIAMAGDRQFAGLEEMVLVVSGATGGVIWEQVSAPGDRLVLSTAARSDVNDDGVRDLLFGHIGPDADLGEVRTLDGATGRLLSTIAPPRDSLEFGTRTAELGDVNADGEPDLLVTDAFGPASDLALGVAVAVSGRDHSTLWAHSGRRGSHPDAASEPSFFGNVITPRAVDLNGDGAGDIVVAAHVQYVDGIGNEAGEVTALSGRTGAALWRTSGDRVLELSGINTALAGDVNGDGVEDILVGAPQHFGSVLVLGGVGRAVVLSGRDGSVLVEINGEAAGTKRSDGLGLGGDGLGGDINGDGRADLVLSAFGADAADAQDAGIVFAVSCAP